MNKTNKNMLILGSVFLIYPFIATIAYAIVPNYTGLIKSPFIWSKISHTVDFMTSYSTYAISFLFSSILGFILILRVKKESIYPIIIFLLGLLFSYTSFYLI